MAIMPRYTSSGIAVATPQGQFRDVSAPMDQLSSQMDRMTGFFIQEAKQQAVVEGEKYGADKAPTREQIQLAASTGTPLPQVGDSSTIFGRSAMKASAEIASTSISYAALEELQKVKMDMESGSVSPNAGLQKINAMVDGYSSALSNIDPTAAKKLEAELAYRGNITYVAASKAAASAAAKQAKDAAEAELSNRMGSISDIVQSGDTLMADGTMLSLDQKREQERAVVVNKAAKVGGAAFAITVGTKFDEKWKSATKASISFWATDPDGNSAAKLRQLQTGKIEDKTILSLWKSLSIEEKDATLNTAIDRANKSYDLIKSEKNKAEEDDKEQIKNLTNSFHFNLFNGNKDAMEDNLKNLNQIYGGSEKANDLRKLTEPKDKVINDTATEREFFKKEVDGTLTLDEVVQAVTDGKLNASTGRAYSKRISASEDKGLKDAIEAYKVSINYYQTFDKDSAMQKVAKMRQNFLNAKEANPNLDPSEWFKTQSESTNKSVDKTAADNATAELRKFATQNGIQPKNGKYDVMVLEKAIANSFLNTTMTDIDKSQNPLVKAIKSLRAQGIKEF